MKASSNFCIFRVKNRMQQQAKQHVSVWDLRSSIASMLLINESVHGFFAQLDYTFHDSIVKMMDAQKAYLGHDSDCPYESYVPIEADHPTHKRTRLWVPRLYGIMKQFQDKQIMIQVGNDHCVGPTGLPELLRKLGWTVKPVCKPISRKSACAAGMETELANFAQAPVTAGG
jgi:hypothetical protein